MTIKTIEHKNRLQFLEVTQPDQIECVAALACDIWEHYYPPITGMRQTRYMLENYQSPDAITQHLQQGYRYFLTQHADTNIGYFAIAPHTATSSVQLSKIYLTEAYRHLGHGARIIRFVEQCCQELDAQELWLTVNRHNQLALAFYHKMGFNITGPLVQDIGQGYVMDDYRMAKLVCLTGAQHE